MSDLVLTVQPNGDESHYQFSSTLDGARYVVDVYTNTVDGGWYLDVANDDGSSVVRGIALALGVNILAPYRHEDLPPGHLYVVELGDGTGGNDPDLTAFAEGRAALHYREVDA